MIYVVENNVNFNLEQTLSDISKQAHELINEFEYSVLEYKYNFLVENGYILEKAGDQVKKNLFEKFKEMIRKLVESIKRARDAIVKKVADLIEKFKNDKEKAEEKRKAESIKIKAEKAFENFKKEAETIILDITEDDIISPEESRRLKNRIVATYDARDAEFKKYASDLNM